jgi:thiamine biosynthesis lipoprotein
LRGARRNRVNGQGGAPSVSLRRRLGGSIAQLREPCLRRPQLLPQLGRQQLGLGGRELGIGQCTGGVQVGQLLQSGGKLRRFRSSRGPRLSRDARLGWTLAGSAGRETEAAKQSRCQQPRPSDDDETTSEHFASFRLQAARRTVNEGASPDNAFMPQPIPDLPPLPSAVAPASSPLPGLRRVEQIMGTAISLDVRDSGVMPGALADAFEYLRQVDNRFSTYKPESEVSRLGRGEIQESEWSPELHEVLELCEQVRRDSEGYFDIRAHRTDGGLDPSGLVKGWSLEKAGRILEAAGALNYCINGGGDIVARGEAAPGQAWRIGIRHPLVADRLAAVLAVRDGSVATSGAYERGEHVRNPFTNLAPSGVLSITIVGPRLTFADAYATAAFAMGPTGLAWVAGRPGYEGCVVTADADGSNARLAWTPGFDSWFAERG